MTKRKILHITQATGGVKTYVAHVMDYVQANAFEFVAIAPADVHFEKFCSEHAVPYYIINLERGNNPFKNLGTLYQIVKVIKKEKPDIIHAHSAKGGFLGRLAAKLTGVNVIYTPHAFSYLSFRGVKRSFFFMLEVMARKWTTLLLSISYSEAKRAISEVGYPEDRVKTILNSIPVAPAYIPPLQRGYKKIRMIGRLTAQKNPLLFLAIAKQLLDKYPHLEFSILGAGIHDDLTIEIEDYIKLHNMAANVRIERWGYINTSESFLREADIYLMTSTFEGLPFSLLEAMLAGVPCVVSKVEGNTDVIQNGENGFSCLSVDEFCAKIELLITDEALRAQIGQAGRDYVIANHNIETNMMQLEQIYTQLV